MADEPVNPIAEAIQQVLDAYGDGWSLSSYLVVMGLEKIADDGRVETSKWWYAPPDQHEDFTTALAWHVDEQVNGNADVGGH